MLTRAACGIQLSREDRSALLRSEICWYSVTVRTKALVRPHGRLLLLETGANY